jgi:hypothetical protein
MFNECDTVWIYNWNDEDLGMLEHLECSMVANVDSIKDFEEDTEGHLDGNEFTGMMCSINHGSWFLVLSNTVSLLSLEVDCLHRSTLN